MPIDLRRQLVKLLSNIHPNFDAMLESQRHLFDLPRDVCFLDAAAWSPLPLATVEEGKRGLLIKSRPWEMPADIEERQFERARRAAARLINATPDDVAIIPSVGYGVATAAKILDLPPGERVLVLQDDHTSPVLQWLPQDQDTPFELERVRPGPDRDWTRALVEAVSDRSRKPPGLLSVSSIHWSDGGHVNLRKVKSALDKRGGYLLVDATHSIGAAPFHVAQIDPDFVLFPTYKWLLGPYGRAFAYIAKRHQQDIPLEQTFSSRKKISTEQMPYLADLSYVDSARRFDMGERDFFISLAMASTSMEIVDSWGTDRVSARLAMLTQRISDGLSERNLPVSFLPTHLRAPHLLCLEFDGGMPDDLMGKLQSHGVYAACRLGRMRLSPHVYNDEADCDRLVEVLEKLLKA